MSRLALLFLSFNGYTVYMVINAELEMLLSFLIVLTFYCILNKSSASYLISFFVGITKWDSVFIIPAAMISDFFFRKKRFLALLGGCFASLGLIAWILMSMILPPQIHNPYIGEISRRVPNIYLFIMDILFVATGFVQWAGSYLYNNFSSWIFISPLYLLLLIILILTFFLIILGIRKLILNRTSDALALLTFFCGFILIHSIYQNSKTRYFVPILWLVNFLIFYAFEKDILPFIKKKLNNVTFQNSWSKPIILLTSGLLLLVYLSSFIPFVFENKSIIIIFALSFTAIGSYLIIPGRDIASRKSMIIIVVLIGILINLQCYFCINMMDHYSLRRVEFKDVALWFKENSTADDILLISESNIPKYYTGFPQKRFFETKLLKSKDYKSLPDELSTKNINFIFIDNFYIERLKVGDKNSFYRKADILKDLRDNFKFDKRYSIEKIFTYSEQQKSYLLRFSSSNRQ
ncbi:MAG TPA: hypothetical protein PK341_17565 [Spirochaetota bacterium]|nr:hypothetical protein [Spirochaetota bacterium]